MRFQFILLITFLVCATNAQFENNSPIFFSFGGNVQAGNSINNGLGKLFADQFSALTLGVFSSSAQAFGSLINAMQSDLSTFPTRMANSRFSNEVRRQIDEAATDMRKFIDIITNSVNAGLTNTFSSLVTQSINMKINKINRLIRLAVAGVPAGHIFPETWNEIIGFRLITGILTDLNPGRIFSIISNVLNQLGLGQLISNLFAAFNLNGLFSFGLSSIYQLSGLITSGLLGIGQLISNLFAAFNLNGLFNFGLSSIYQLSGLITSGLSFSSLLNRGLSGNLKVFFDASNLNSLLNGNLDSLLNDKFIGLLNGNLDSLLNGNLGNKMAGKLANEMGDKIGGNSGKLVGKVGDLLQNNGEEGKSIGGKIGGGIGGGIGGSIGGPGGAFLGQKAGQMMGDKLQKSDSLRNLGSIGGRFLSS